MTYSLIALDIDGTIRSPEYPISGRTLEAITRARSTGAVVTVATGRIFQSARKACADLDLKDPIVAFQGAMVGDPYTGSVMWHQPLSTDMTMEALSVLGRARHEILSYVGDDIYVTAMTPRAEAYADRNEIDIHVVTDLRETAILQPTRLVVFGLPQEILGLEDELKQHFGTNLYITKSLETFCEILNPSSGKEKALSWLCSQIGVSESNTLVFGNGYNDVPMLNWAGCGVAISGSVQDALDVCDKMAPPIEEDGVAQVIEEFLDEGLIGFSRNF